MINIKFFEISTITPNNCRKLIDSLPSFMQEKALKYRFEEDKLRSGIGKILLKDLLIGEGYPEDVLNYVKIDNYQRPFLNTDIDFNISHSGDYVICAVSKNNRVGIDIEKMVALNIHDFEYVLTNDERQQLLNDKDPLDRFYTIWTQKEAVIKANGRGFEIELTGVLLNNNIAICEHKEWNLKKLDINYNYKSYLAAQIIDEINISELTIDAVLDN